MNAVIPMQVPSENLKAALAYAAIGWHVFPCHSINDGRCDCGNPVCKSPGKHPISALAPRGQDSATILEETIRQWWTQRPGANIAVFLGQSGLCAVDSRSHRLHGAQHVLRRRRRTTGRRSKAGTHRSEGHRRHACVAGRHHPYGGCHPLSALACRADRGSLFHPQGRTA